MDNRRQSSPARLAAVLALVAAFVVLVVVVGTSLGGGNSGGGSKGPDEPQQRVRLNERGEPQKLYIVKPGDTLSTIAEKVNVPVEELQRLNPDIDPQALGSGERVKIR
ncbi:MAG: LysM domain-containing protein [Actinomycetota bacterium]